MASRQMVEEFKNPGVEWRGKPFWSWNGKLEKEEMLRQIDVLRDMGMGGFFMHSRTGLETEYLGDEWFDLINACSDYAESIGLEAWLYDEDRWPSGLAGGIVSRHPEFRQKAILLEINSEKEGRNVIAEFSCDVDGAICTNLGSGNQTIRFSVVEQGKSGFYNGFTYVDTMNRAATEAFLQSTHEKYAAKCGERLGRSIKGIFTDEPHRGALLTGFSMYRDDGALCTPYTPKLFDEFQKRFGYDLKQKLPELFFQLDGKRVSPVKWHYAELLQQLFLENFLIPYKEWCEKHSLILSGHALHEDSLTAQTAMCGSMMRCYEHMSWPGVDVLGEHNKNYWIVKQCASTARQTGEKRMLSELYGCTGWQMPFAGHKAVGDWQALLGINLRCHHLSWYTMRGESKRDYPASILHQSAWYREYKHIEDYFARFGFLMAQGEPVCDLLVLNPVESFWAQVHVGWCNAFSLQDDHLKKLEKNYQTLFTWLLESQIDFDYGDEEMLGRIGIVENGVLNVGCAQYKTVLVSGMDTIRSTTIKLLDRFVKAGGTVIVAGDAPTHVDAVSSSKSPVSGFKQVAFAKDAVLAAVPAPLATVSAPDIFGQLRKTEDGLIFAALNVNRDECRENAVVLMKTDLPISEWDCETGEIKMVRAQPASNDWKQFTVDFPKAGNKIWIASEKFQALETAEPTGPSGEWEKISGPFDYTLSEPNICVLDAAEYKLDADWQPETDVLKIDRALRDAHGVMRRGAVMCQPWFAAQHPVRDLCDVELRYSFDIETMPKWIDLVLEEPERFKVEINGMPLDTSGAIQWIDVAFRRVRIPSAFLKPQRNEITLQATYKEDSNLEAIYLLGDFGVRLSGARRTLVPITEKIQIGDICLQGFPFYSGAITCHVSLPARASRLRLPPFGGACAKVNGQILGWDPFEANVSGNSAEVEIVLTRRNTFGPLHDLVKDRSMNHSSHWLTDGDEFTSECILIPSGLLNGIMVKGGNFNSAANVEKSQSV